MNKDNKKRLNLKLTYLQDLISPLQFSLNTFQKHIIKIKSFIPKLYNDNDIDIADTILLIYFCKEYLNEVTNDLYQFEKDIIDFEDFVNSIDNGDNHGL